MLVIPLIYRSVTIDISNEGSVREENVYETLVQRLLAGPSVCVLVKELSVVKQGAYVNPHLRNSELLASLIPRLVRLEVFRWEIKDSFPEGLDQSLLWKASDSRFRLHLDIGFKYEVDDLRIHHKFLGQACHTLSTLRIYIPSGYYAPTDNRRVKSRLFSALKDCTNLRILSIYGHDRRIRSINGPWLVVEPGESLPSLRDLSVTDNSDTLRREDLEIWGANGRWSNLQKVTFRDPQLLDGIHGCEKTLISINLLEVSESFQTPLTDICSRLDHLRELRVGGKHLCIPVLALKKCGHSLKSLVMRGHDEYCQELANKVPLESLQLVHDYCPVLSKMDMSIDWPSGGLVGF